MVGNPFHLLVLLRFNAVFAFFNHVSIITSIFSHKAIEGQSNVGRNFHAIVKSIPHIHTVTIHGSNGILVKTVCLQKAG